MVAKLIKNEVEYEKALFMFDELMDAEPWGFRGRG